MKTTFLWGIIFVLVAIILATFTQPAPNVIVVEEPAFRYGYWRDDWAYTRPWGVGGYSWGGHRPHGGHKPGHGAGFHH